MRLAEIDAPEKSQAFGQASKKSLSELVYRRTVLVRIVNIDRYGRIVGRVYANGTDVNLEQVSRGLAWAYVRYVEDTKIPTTETIARSARRGLWSDAHPTAPWDFRRAGGERYSF